MIFLLSGSVSVFAIDSPHGSYDCSACHSLHGSSGAGLTNQPDNETLCIVCHSPSGDASDKPFASGMIADPVGGTGTSHSWEAVMETDCVTYPTKCGPDSDYGLRAPAELTNSALQTRLTMYGNKITCGVCHDQHAQANDPWDPFSLTTAGAPGRHYMRMPNDMNELCEDCHYYRTPASGQTDTRTWDGNYKSHPVVKTFSSDSGETPDVSNPQTFLTSPAEPGSSGYALQTGGIRYHQNGGGDTNVSNNVVLDSNGQVRCLSCHGVHYTDSDSITVDQP
jgi:predicted CXXCH cytochrome family protein